MGALRLSNGQVLVQQDNISGTEEAQKVWVQVLLQYMRSRQEDDGLSRSYLYIRTDTFV